MLLQQQGTHKAAWVGDCRWWIMLAWHSPAARLFHASKRGIEAAVTGIRKQTRSHRVIFQGPWTEKHTVTAEELARTEQKRKNKSFKSV